MDLRLLISLALYYVWRADARPQVRGAEGGLQEAISQLHLLNELTATNQLTGDDWSTSPKAAKTSRKLQSESDPDQVYSIMHRAEPPPSPVPVPILTSRPVAPHKLYSSDGPFSDIPSDAFRLEHRKEFRLPAHNRGGGGGTKKDLNGHAHKQTHTTAHAAALAHTDNVPESLMRTCLNYFRGRSPPKRSSLELVLDLCTELVDGNGVGDFALDDDKRQDMYELGADGRGSHHHHNLGPGVAVDCVLCPHGQHVMKTTLLEHDDDDDDDDSDGDDREDVRSEVSLSDLLELFKPVGNRREWMVINSKNPDERMRTYVDLKK